MGKYTHTEDKMSTPAQAAKMIRQDLKQAFPEVSFSVTSKRYSGGSSVSIAYENGPTCEAVDTLVGKYEYGHFDGMEDIYRYSNTAYDLPQVKFVQVYRTTCETICQQVFAWLQKTHEHFDKVLSIDEAHNDLQRDYGAWTPREYISRILSKIDLTHGYTEPQGINI